MLRAVVDPGVLVSGVISPHGAPARILELFAAGAFDLVVSTALLAELEDVVERPRIAERLPPREAGRLLRVIRATAETVDDPPLLRGVTPDPKDDYLISLARASRADLVVSGDRHLTELRPAEPRVLTPRAFVDLLETLEPEALE